MNQDLKNGGLTQTLSDTFMSLIGIAILYAK